MEEQASFVRAVIEDNTRLREEIKKLEGSRDAAGEAAQKESYRLQVLCGAPDAKRIGPTGPIDHPRNRRKA